MKRKPTRPADTSSVDTESILRDALAFQDAAARRAMQLARQHLLHGKALQAALRAHVQKHRRIIV